MKSTFLWNYIDPFNVDQAHFHNLIKRKYSKSVLYSTILLFKMCEIGFVDEYFGRILALNMPRYKDACNYSGKLCVMQRCWIWIIDDMHNACIHALWGRVTDFHLSRIFQAHFWTDPRQWHSKWNIYSQEKIPAHYIVENDSTRIE